MPAIRPASGRSRRRPAEALTTDAVPALMKARSRRARTGIRNRAPVAVMWRAKPRISEALELELHDVDRDGGSPPAATARVGLQAQAGPGRSPDSRPVPALTIARNPA
jgi:site-specific recombinase XerD